MTTKFRVLSMVIFLNAIALPFVANADSLKQASPADVQMLLKAAKGENTANGATYIGQTKDRT